MLAQRSRNKTAGLDLPEVAWLRGQLDDLGDPEMSFAQCMRSARAMKQLF